MAPLFAVHAWCYVSRSISPDNVRRTLFFTRDCVQTVNHFATGEKKNISNMHIVERLVGGSAGTITK